MSDINKLISDLTKSLSDLKELNLSESIDLKGEALLDAHKKIKEVQKFTSEFQQVLSPIQKGINRKRIDYLKKSGKSKEKTKSELVQELEQLKLLLKESTPKEL